MASIQGTFVRAKESTASFRQHYSAGVKSMNTIKNLKNHFKIAGGCVAASTAGVTAGHALGLNLLSGLTAGTALATGPLAACVALGGLLGGTVIALDGLDSIVSEGKRALARKSDSASRTLLGEDIGRSHAHNDSKYNESDIDINMELAPAA